MWFYKEQVFDTPLQEFDSFVYIIERLNVLEDDTSPIYYIGKKTFFYKRKFKGKRIIIESNWWDYYGSSEWLNADVEKYGKHSFKRTILHLCRTKGDAGYLEAKEQIEKNVLHQSDDGYKLFYNKNILARYTNEPELYIIEGDLKDYYNLDYIHGNSHGKLWINNSNENKLVSKKIADEMFNSGNWFYGRCEKHIDVNDGLLNYTIEKSKFNENIHLLGHIKKYITNGIKDKFLPIHEIEKYIENNNEWYDGCSKNNNDIWITDGNKDKKIKKNTLEEYPEYKPGRTNAGLKNKISIYKDDNFMWILETDLTKYLVDGWVRKGKAGIYNLYIVTNNVNQKHFRNYVEKEEFLKNNPEWRNGQLHRESFNTKDIVFAKDMRTDEKATVTKSEYKSNKYLTSISTKKVKIKKKNKIIFKGYLDLFLLENPHYPKNQLMNALRTQTGDVSLMKGKNTWLNDEMLNIRWL